MYTYFHDLSPILVSLGSMQVRYYGLVYAFGLVVIWLFLRKLFKENYFADSNLRSLDDVDTMTIMIATSTFVFARLFEIFVYNPGMYLTNPFEIIAIWHGGMSILGGFIGASIAMYYLARKYHCSFFLISDAVLLYVPLLLVFGRLANFVNAELIGRVATNFPICIDYSKNAYLLSQNMLITGCRYPSQLLEAAKNLVLFIILFYAYKKYYVKNAEYYETQENKKSGLITSLFFLLYSAMRFFVEFYREPDYSGAFTNVLGFALDMNQILFSVFFILMAAAILIKKIKNPTAS